jgi:hypothetical protein
LTGACCPTMTSIQAMAESIALRSHWGDLRRSTDSTDEITAVENDYALPSGKPTLGDAYAMLKARWQAGRRDLETGLRLMFLAWYSCAEPPFLTGLPTKEDTWRVFQEVFAHFGGAASTDPELLHGMSEILHKNGRSQIRRWCQSYCHCNPPSLARYHPDCT